VGWKNFYQMKKIGVSIIIPTYKRKKLLGKIINYLSRQNFPKELYEIIIIDSFNSVNLNFKSNYLVKKYNIFENSNAKKRNFGLIKSNFQNIIFIDDDCIPEKNFLFKFFIALNKIDYKSILCGSVRYPNFLIKKNPYISYRAKTHFEVKKNIFNINNTLDPRYIVTMNMGFKNKKNSIIFFNKKFKNYGFEDYEFGYRLIKKGYKFFKANPLIYHFDNRKFSYYLKKFYFLGRIGSYEFKKIDFRAYMQTNYYFLEKLLKKNSFFKIFIFLLSNLNTFFYYLNYCILFKSNFLIKINMSLSFLLGCADRLKSNTRSYKWYK
jgi:glycosyltransferase involved in cell wall biosynthesis